MPSQRYIAGILGACIALLGSAGVAGARPTAVSIKTEPAGASVWIDDRASEPAGSTPLNVRLEPGTYILYIELDGYEAMTREITVRRRKRDRFSFALKEVQTGSILVLAAEGSSAANEATVLLDGKEVGTVPDSFDVAEGRHELEVRREGYDTFTKTVEVTKGESIEVSVELVKQSGVVVADGDDDGEPPPDTVLSESSSRPARMTLFTIGASLGSAYRSYDYVELDEMIRPLRKFEAATIGVGEIAAELHLGGLSSASWLRPFSLFGTASINLPTQASSDDGDEDITTVWFRRDAGLRTRFALGSLWLAVELAEGADSLSFSGVGEVPFADDLPEFSYQYLRVGTRIGYDFGGNSLGIGGDGILAIAVDGVVDEVFDDDDAYGFRAQAWYRRHIVSDIHAMMIGRFQRVAHTFKSDENIADGAVDSVFDLLINVAYQY